MNISGIEASVAVWRLLHGQKLQILDAIELGPDGIKGWLFTASDGTVKSKQVARYA